MKTPGRDFVIKSVSMCLFSLHCEYLTDKDDLPTKTAKMKKDLTTLRGWLREAEL